MNENIEPLLIEQPLLNTNSTEDACICTNNTVVNIDLNESTDIVENVYNESVSEKESTCSESIDTNNWNVLCLNCCGLKKKTRYPEFENLVCKHDIICLQERKTDDFDQIDIPGYVFKLKNRKTKSRNKSGGIALGFKEQLSDKISPVETECRFVFWFKVSADLLNTNADGLFGIVYIPPEYTSYSSDYAYREIQNEYLMFSPNYECVCLLGDFNSRTATDDDFIFIDDDDPSRGLIL